MSSCEDQSLECPLCMEPLEMDDINFFPCTCGYQICRFCWHRIRTDENGLCPACRKQYPEDPADFKPLSVEELQKIKTEKRQKDQQRKQKISENRKHLANVRVVQKNLVFVVGLPPRLADTEVLKKHDYFGKFGKIHKVVVNHTTSYAGSQGPSASAYVTYLKGDDALRAIQAVNNIQVDGRTLKSSLGTTKYCSHFLKNQQCPKTDCMYLHELGDEAASFTKEEMQHGKHQEYEKKLHEQMLGMCNVNRKQTSSPFSQNQQSQKEVWPSLQGGKNGEVRLNGLNKSNKEHKNNSTKCRHGSGDENHKSNKRNRLTDEKSHKISSGSKENRSAHLAIETNDDKNSTDRRPPSRGSTNSTHSSTSSLNCSPSDGCQQQCITPPNWSQSTSSSSSAISAEIPYDIEKNSSSCNMGIEDSPGSLSPTYSDSPTQSSPFGSLSSNTAPSPPLLNIPSSPQISSSSSGWMDSITPIESIHPRETIPPFKAPLNTNGGTPGGGGHIGSVARLPSDCHLIGNNQMNQQMNPIHHSNPNNIGSGIPSNVAMNSGLNVGMNSGHRLENTFPNMYSAKRMSHLQNGEWTANSEHELGLVNDRINNIMKMRSHIENSNNDTDWQAAFGFGSSPKSQDDDLGFDPWDESSKGLADLLEMEANRRHENGFHFGGGGPSQGLINAMPQHLRHSQHQMSGIPRMANHFPVDNLQRGPPLPHHSMPSVRRVAAPPPGFAPNHVNAFGNVHRPPFSCDPDAEMMHSMKNQSAMNGGSIPPPFYHENMVEAQMRTNNHMKNMNPNCMPNLRPKVGDSFNSKDWQEGLRSLLPNISISFGPPQHSNNQQIGPRMNPLPLKNHTQMWNGSQSSDMPWPAQDTSILGSGSVADVPLGRSETPPHWMKSLQQLTLEDGSVAFSNQQVPPSPLFAFRAAAQWPTATTPQMPPPGFSVPRRANDSQAISENL